MYRQPLAYRVHHLVAVEPHETTGYSPRSYRIDQNDMPGGSDLIEQQQPERTALNQAQLTWDVILALQARERRRPQTVVGEQHIAESEYEDATSVCCHRVRVHGQRTLFRFGVNLKPENMESKIPKCSTSEYNTTKYTCATAKIRMAHMPM